MKKCRGCGAVIQTESKDKEGYYNFGGADNCYASMVDNWQDLNDEKETELTLKKHSDGLIWMHTGDLGYMDKDGFIYFKQRLKRVIVSSGYCIYPQYIENIIDSHPDVLMSCVIGIDHPYKVQVAKAFIVLKNGIAANDEILRSIKEHCEKNLAKYSWP